MMRRLLKPAAVLGLVLALTAGIETFVTTKAARSNDRIPNLSAACATDNPYLVTPCYRGIMKDALNSTFEKRAPALIMFQDTPNDVPEYKLADFYQLGTVWGLAYNAAEPAIYAAAFTKRQLPYGPGGPGAIYRLDLKTLAVTTFATIPNAGQDHHVGSLALPDKDMVPWVGRMGLGDLDLNAAGTELYAMNLLDKKIYRLAVPSGQILGSFDHGAAAEPWARDARPFALAFHDGLLYHGVVSSAATSGKRNELVAYVYASDPDGGRMRRVAEIPLDYLRGRLKLGPGSRNVNVRWQVWTDKDPPRARGTFPFAMNPQPILTDIEFDAANAMILGFRDRTTDTTAQSLVYKYNGAREEQLAMGVGDILRGTLNGSTWDFAAAPEYYQDDVPYLGDESTTGGLAEFQRTNEIVAAAIGMQDFNDPPVSPAEGLIWFDNATGEKWRREQTCSVTYMRLLDPATSVASFKASDRVERALAYGDIPLPPPYKPIASAPVAVRGPGSMGDVEVLCPLETVGTGTATPALSSP